MNKPFNADSRNSATLAKALFAPDSIALIGASGDATKHASLPQRYLRKHGYKGAIFPVNPSRDELFGERAYSSVDKIPHPIEHAFIMLPAPLVLAAIKQCADHRVHCATIFSAGFAETDEEGRKTQEAIIQVASSAGMRILGPNCLGVINTHQRVSLSANEALETPTLFPGRMSLLSQSGSLMGSLLSRAQARGLGFAKMVSVGNEADLGIGEIGDLLVDDADTDVILLFIETIRDQKRFSAMSRRAFAAGKPVIAYLLGRSDLGNKLAASHTGAIAGNTAAIEAFLRDNGVMRVDMIETLFEMAPMVIGRRPPGAARINVMTTTGGGGALIVDNLGLRGVQATAPGEAVVAKLAKQDIRIMNSPLIDLTLTGTNPKVFGAVLDSLIESRDSNAVVAVVGSSSQYRPERAVVPIIDRARKSDKPVAAFLTPDATESAHLLSGASVAVFRTPETCGDAMRAYFDWKVPVPAGAIDRAPPAELVRIAQGHGIASASEVSRILELLSIDQARIVALPIKTDSTEIETRVRHLKFPVAVKIDSPDIPHKTEAGGVVLNVADIKTLASALSSIRETVHKRRPDAKLDGFIVQEMRSGVGEVLLGYRVDPHVGPTIAVGVGGVLAEIYRDVVVALAPVSIDAAYELIGKVRGFAPIRGYRNLPAGDIKALAQVIAAWSSLAAIPQSRIVEAELNPIVVGIAGKGVAAVDALIVRAD